LRAHEAIQTASSCAESPLPELAVRPFLALVAALALAGCGHKQAEFDGCEAAKYAAVLPRPDPGDGASISREDAADTAAKKTRVQKHQAGRPREVELPPLHVGRSGRRCRNATPIGANRASPCAHLRVYCRGALLPTLPCQTAHRRDACPTTLG